MFPYSFYIIRFIIEGASIVGLSNMSVVGLLRNSVRKLLRKNGIKGLQLMIL